MDQWWDWVPWGLAVLGGIFGIRGEIRARRAEKRAERAEEVTPWEEARHLSGDMFAVRNGSTRDVVVTEVRADPAEKAFVFSFRHALPMTIYAGDSLEFFSEPRLALSRPDVVLEWRFSDSKDSRTTRRIVAGAVPS